MNDTRTLSEVADEWAKLPEWARARAGWALLFAHMAEGLELRTKSRLASLLVETQTEERAQCVAIVERVGVDGAPSCTTEAAEAAHSAACDAIRDAISNGSQEPVTTDG